MPNSEGRILRVLMVGSLPPPIGGITVSQKILVDLLQRRSDVQITVLDVNAIRRRKGQSLRGFLCLLRRVVGGAKHVDVVAVYLASTALPLLGLFLLIVCQVLGKPFIVRKAANLDYFDLGSMRGFIAHFVVKRSDLYLAETKKLVQLAIKRGISHVKWYPTSRPMSENSELLPLTNRSCRRFVFVGQVRQCKGIREIVEAGERFADDINIDIYGPVFGDIETELFDNCKRVKYRGVLAAENVISVLNDYDVLLLPTMAKSEGYPGVVFEAYSAGLPVITTRCGGIPEIVDETSGVFVEPGNAEMLFAAMKTIVDQDDLFERLRYGVIARRSEFDSSIWAENFVKYCEEVVSAAT